MAFGRQIVGGASLTGGHVLGKRLVAQRYQYVPNCAGQPVRCQIRVKLCRSDAVVSCRRIFGVTAGNWLRISGAGRQGDPYLRPPRLGPRPFTISVVKSFADSFV